MVKDTLNSMLDNIKERTTNPFLGTLLVVWVVKNWTLVYSLFYFDSSLKLKDRLQYISTYFAEHSFILNMVFVILITLGVLLLTYLLLSLSRLITDVHERIIIPLISKATDRSSIVLKTEYTKLQDVVKQLEIRLEEERLAKVAVQNERDALDQKLYSQQNPQTKLDNIPTKSELAYTFERVKTKFEGEGKVSEVNSIIRAIQTTKTISRSNNVLKTFLLEGFATFDENDEITEGKAYYSLTEEGRQFLRYWNNSHG